MILKWIWRTILALLIIIILFFGFLLTPYGLKFTAYMAQKFAPGKLNYENVSGSILNNITITKFDYRHNKQHIHTDNLQFTWSPTALIHKHLEIKKLTADGIDLTLPLHQKTNDKAKHDWSLSDIKPFQPKQLKLPISITINHAHITNIRYRKDVNKVALFIKAVDVNGTIENHHINLTAHAEIIQPQHMFVDLTAAGKIQDYKIDIHAKNTHYDFTLHGTGNKNSAVITIPESKLFDGSIKSKLALTWYPKIAWDIKLNAQKLNLQLLNRTFPASTTIALNTKGSLEKNNPVFDLTTNIHADSAMINANMHHHKQWNGKWSINIPHLRKLYDDASGSLISNGTVHGATQKLITKGSLSGDSINIGNISFTAIHSKWNLMLGHDTISTASIKSGTISYKGRDIASINLGFNGDLAKHNVNLNLNIGKHQIISLVHAHFKGENWTGKVTKFISRHNAFGNWTLKNPAIFAASKTHILLKPLCLNANTGAYLCTHADWQKGKTWNFGLHTKNVSFTKLEKKALIQTRFTSKLSINSEASGTAQGINQGKLNIQLTPGYLIYVLKGQVITTPIRPSNITVNIGKNGLVGDTNLMLAIKDHLKAQVNIPEFTDHSIPMNKKKLSGNIQMLMHDFRFVTLIESMLKLSVGKLSGSFHLFGTLGKPKFTGDATLHLPSFAYTTAMIHAQDLTAHVKANNSKLTFNLTGYAHNKAPIYLKGKTDLTEPNAVTKFMVTTKNAELIKNNQLDVFANATMNFLITHTKLSIHGDILVPKANLAPINFSSTLTIPKKQLILIGLPKSQVQKSKHATDVKLNIKLGKNVVLAAYGLRANLAGGIVLTITPDESIMANGQVRILDGTFQAYGQYLSLSKDSAISFIQSPVSNPFIDARAYKLINTTVGNFGQQAGSDMITAGVHIHGTIKNMQFSLYSQPSGISQADILSYLVLGYANGSASAANLSVLLDAANDLIDSGGGLNTPIGLTDRIKQGLGIDELGIRNETELDVLGNPVDQQSSFVIGDKISRNIYIQYSRGMLVPDNTLQVQYRLNKNWLLQTNAGSSGEGADVLYTISKD